MCYVPSIVHKDNKYILAQSIPEILFLESKMYCKNIVTFMSRHCCPSNSIISVPIIIYIGTRLIFTVMYLLDDQYIHYFFFYPPTLSGQRYTYFNRNWSLFNLIFIFQDFPTHRSMLLCLQSTSYSEFLEGLACFALISF